VKAPILYELFEVMGVAAFVQATQDGHYFCNRFISGLDASKLFDDNSKNIIYL